VADIHPTALIDPEVEIAADAYVGPYCVLRGRVKIGPGCKLYGNAYVHGPLTMGHGNRVYPFSCLGFAPQDLKFDPTHLGSGVTIGESNVFREGFSIHRAANEHPTRVGNHNYCMANSHVGHDAVIGDHCILAHGSMIGGHAQLADGVNIGGNGGMHQFCRTGRLAMIAGQTAATQDVPPFCVMHHNRGINSLNLIALRRAGYRVHIDPLRRAFDIFFRGRHLNPVALDLIVAELGHYPLCMEFVEFIRHTRRGITKWRRESAAE
jgi:UDP-N-acetylglucosamine acyltransferase